MKVFGTLHKVFSVLPRRTHFSSHITRLSEAPESFKRCVPGATLARYIHCVFMRACRCFWALEDSATVCAFCALLHAAVCLATACHAFTRYASHDKAQTCLVLRVLVLLSINLYTLFSFSTLLKHSANFLTRMACFVMHKAPLCLNALENTLMIMMAMPYTIVCSRWEV